MTQHAGTGGPEAERHEPTLSDRPPAVAPSAVSEPARRRPLERAMVVIAMTVTVITAMTLALYAVTFTGRTPPSWPLSLASTEWANFGSFTGGVLGPVFAGASMLAVLLALLLQTQQLELARRQARDQQQEAERLAADQRATLQALRDQVEIARQQHEAARELHAVQRAMAEAIADQATHAITAARVSVLTAALEALAREAGGATQLTEGLFSNRAEMLRELTVLTTNKRAKLA